MEDRPISVLLVGSNPGKACLIWRWWLTPRGPSWAPTRDTCFAAVGVTERLLEWKMRATLIAIL